MSTLRAFCMHWTCWLDSLLSSVRSKCSAYPSGAELSLLLLNAMASWLPTSRAFPPQRCSHSLEQTKLMVTQLPKRELV